MRKKLIFVVVIALAALFLGACGDATITYGVYNYQSGEIVQEFTVEIGESNPKEVAELVGVILQAYGYEVEVENYTVTAARYFESRTDYDIYYGITGDEPYESQGEDYYKEGGVFYNKYITKMQTVFANIEKEVTSGYAGIMSDIEGLQENEVIKLIRDYADKIEELEYDALKYVFIYGTYYRSLDSDADIKSYDRESGLYLHTFEMQGAERTRTITLIQSGANYLTWAALALGAALVVAASFWALTRKIKR